RRTAAIGIGGLVATVAVTTTVITVLSPAPKAQALDDVLNHIALTADQSPPSNGFTYVKYLRHPGAPAREIEEWDSVTGKAANADTGSGRLMSSPGQFGGNFYGAYDNLRALPTDPGALIAYLRRHDPHVAVVVNLTQIATQPVAPPALR